MKFNSLIPELTVVDLEQTKKFYIDVLHFSVEYERQEDKFIFLSLEGNQMMFEEDNGNWSVGILEHPFGRGVNFEMTVSNVDILYKAVLDAGITPFREIKINHYRNGNEGYRSERILSTRPIWLPSSVYRLTYSSLWS